MATPKTKPIPVTILTGYLGAGKTTLLNRILTEEHGRRIAVIENEYGEIGIDNDLVIHSEEEIFEMNNGCICCTVRGDLIRILERLLKRRDKFDRILIETTGLADPSPVAQTFFLDEDLAGSFFVDAIVTLVDARHLLQHLDGGSPEAARQLAFADTIVLNKLDLVTPEQALAVAKRVHAINPSAPIHKTINAAVDLKKILDIQGFDLARAAELDPVFKPALEAQADHHEHHENCGCGHDHEHDHDHEDHPVHHHHEHHHHEHESGITSVGIELEGQMNLQRFNAWMQVLTMNFGENLYRYKGVLVAEGKDQRYIFQGIHMLYEGRLDRPWGKDEARLNRFVFIGKNLEREVLVAGFNACLENSSFGKEAEKYAP